MRPDILSFELAMERLDVAVVFRVLAAMSSRCNPSNSTDSLNWSLLYCGPLSHLRVTLAADSGFLDCLYGRLYGVAGPGHSVKHVGYHSR
ncbi:MAG TPA: hypothetical protein VNI77_04535, partial [Nitrososphaera sp.]|nr:hypothetical protein [Nitrososphaera sp.]